MIVLVSPFKSSFDDIGLYYKVPENLEKYIKPGISIDIPFKNDVYLGIILGIIDEETINFDFSKLKEIISVKYETSVLYDYQIELIKWVSKYYFCKIHSSLNLFLPNILRKKIENIGLDLESKKTYNYILNKDKKLTKSQEKSFLEIERAKKNVIFYGVTGSGKTEIYVKLIKKYLDLGKQTLLLVPEIILNSQIFERFKNIFGEDILIINSSITQTQRLKSWIDIFNGNAKIIVGTRSSLFYPYKNLGLVIVDEEHDQSYISDSSPKFDTREVLEYMRKYIDFKLVLASGTPSIKSMAKGLKKDYEIVNLLEEYCGGN